MCPLGLQQLPPVGCALPVQECYLGSQVPAGSGAAALLSSSTRGRTGLPAGLPALPVCLTGTSRAAPLVGPRLWGYLRGRPARHVTRGSSRPVGRQAQAACPRRDGVVALAGVQEWTCRRSGHAKPLCPWTLGPDLGRPREASCLEARQQQPHAPVFSWMSGAACMGECAGLAQRRRVLADCLPSPGCAAQGLLNGSGNRNSGRSRGW